MSPCCTPRLPFQVLFRSICLPYPPPPGKISYNHTLPPTSNPTRALTHYGTNRASMLLLAFPPPPFQKKEYPHVSVAPFPSPCHGQTISPLPAPTTIPLLLVPSPYYVRSATVSPLFLAAHTKLNRFLLFPPAPPLLPTAAQ